MHEGLDTFEKYLHQDDPFPPLIRLAFIHYQFEALHPFVDGNGRIGRLLVSLLMVNWNLLPLPLLCLSAFFEANRQAYYDLLFGVSARGAWLEWLSFFLQGVAEQARDASTRAKKLQDLQVEWHQRLARTRSTGLLFRLVDNLFISPVMSISQAQRFLGVTYRSAKLNVDKLEQAGILRQMGESSYGKTYLAEAILQAIS
jgi:Fic family protein